MDWSYTIKEYVRLEEESMNVKHEFIDGEIRAMAGGTIEHARMIAKLIYILGRQLQDRCRVYSSELRIRVRGKSVITYPDLTVGCGSIEVDDEDDCALVNPTVLFEVTSNSSERYDRGKKFAYYQSIPTLREYVVVSHRQPLIEVFRPSVEGVWSLVERVETTGQVELSSIGCSLDVAEVYRDRVRSPDDDRPSS